MLDDHARIVAERYRLVGQIGQGGMGRVWTARDVLLGRDVAVKELVPPSGLTPVELEAMRERAIREARAIARIDQPNVVRVFDVVYDDGEPWIVMELVPSRSLYDTLQAEGPMAPERVAKIGLGVLGALRAAHRAGLLHRDVKPGNVLLAHDGRVVLTDFGIATAAGDSSMTSTGIVLGSPSYLAPERALDGDVGPAADLWSLGATLYAAVEGKPPYAKSSPMATLAALATELPPPPSRAGALRPALVGLLQRDPALRADVETARRLLVAATVPSMPAGSEVTVSFPPAFAGGNAGTSARLVAPQSPAAPSTPAPPAGQQPAPSAGQQPAAGPRGPQKPHRPLPLGGVAAAGAAAYLTSTTSPVRFGAIPEFGGPQAHGGSAGGPQAHGGSAGGVQAHGGGAGGAQDHGVGFGAAEAEELGTEPLEALDDEPELGPEPDGGQPSAVDPEDLPEAPAAGGASAVPEPPALAAALQVGLDALEPGRGTPEFGRGGPEFGRPGRAAPEFGRGGSESGRGEPGVEGSAAGAGWNDPAGVARYRTGYRPGDGEEPSNKPAIAPPRTVTVTRRRLSRRGVIALVSALVIAAGIATQPLISAALADEETGVSTVVAAAGTTAPAHAATQKPGTAAKPSRTGTKAGPTTVVTKTKKPNAAATTATATATATTDETDADTDTVTGYQVKSMGTGTCLYAPTETGSVQLWECNDSDGEKFSFDSDGTMRVRGRCVSIAGTDDGTTLKLATCSGSKAQLFTYNSSFDIVSEWAYKCVDVPDGSTANGVIAQIWECEGTDNQKWSI
ncbi:protein kinase [Actinoplanes sp. NPDC051851]|uniref:protein kinase domain-containing protein n=1 Tax=Actinoplanes sp. NPDC051851 TaxID=3154753 RepID=UPI003442C33E